MKSRTHSTVALALLALSGACGTEPSGSAAEPLVCNTDGGGEIVFGYQELPSGRLPLHSTVLGENGLRFLLIDDACNYWVYTSDEPPARVWADVRRGRLSAEQLEGVNADLVHHDWAGFVADAPSAPRGAGREMWLRDQALPCGAECADDALAVVDASARWITTLYAAGTPVDDLPLRVEVVAYEGSPEHDPIAEWEGSVSLASLVRPIEATRIAGSRPLLEGADADLLRAIREPFRSGEHGAFGAQVLPVRDDGEIFWVYARQTIPVEDARGLVRAPGSE